MSRSLDDKIIKCPNCLMTIGHQKLDGQILILESGLILFSWCSWQCSCGKNSSWLSALLPDDAVNQDSLYPDSKELEKRAKKGITRLAYDRYRVRIRSGGKEKYLGTFPDEKTAIRMRDAALAESLGYIKKTLPEFRQG